MKLARTIQRRPPTMSSLVTGFDVWPRVAVSELVVLDHHVIGKLAVGDVALHLGIEVAQPAAPDAQEVGVAEDVESVLAIGVDGADALNVEVLEDPMAGARP